MMPGKFIEFKPFYKRNDGAESFKLYDLTSPDLTLSLSSETGFEEIIIIRPWKSDFKDDIEKDIEDLDVLCDRLFGLLHESIERCWNPDEKHLVSVSGGRDSKLLCYVLKNCERKFGADWLGQCAFVHREIDTSSGGTSILFWQLMRLLGWEDMSYVVSRKAVDYVDFSPVLIPNSFWPYYYYWYLCFIDDPSKLKDWTLMTGIYGGEILAPRLQDRAPTDDRSNDLKSFVKTGNYYFSIYHNYKNIIQPYLYRPFIEIIFGAAKSLLGGDAIRTRLLRLCGDTIPNHHGYQYNWVCSSDRLNIIQELWERSRFRKDYLVQLGDRKNIKIVNEGMGLWGPSIDSRLFGLAMTYDYGARN